MHAQPGTHTLLSSLSAAVVCYLLLLPACCRQAIMLTWCYLAAVLIDPGQVPPGWHPFPDDAVRAAAAAAKDTYYNYSNINSSHSQQQAA